MFYIYSSEIKNINESHFQYIGHSHSHKCPYFSQSVTKIVSETDKKNTQKKRNNINTIFQHNWMYDLNVLLILDNGECIRSWSTFFLSTTLCVSHSLYFCVSFYLMLLCRYHSYKSRQQSEI